jgi:hypothetical protein
LGESLKDSAQVSFAPLSAMIAARCGTDARRGLMEGEKALKTVATYPSGRQSTPPTVHDFIRVRNALQYDDEYLSQCFAGMDFGDLEASARSVSNGLGLLLLVNDKPEFVKACILNVIAHEVDRRDAAELMADDPT